MTKSGEGDPVQVPADITGLLCALVYGWSPGLPEPKQVAHVRYGEVDISELGMNVQVLDEKLVLTLDELRSRESLAALRPFNLDTKVNGALVDGTTFEMTRICRVGQQTRVSVNEGPVQTMTIEASDWIVIGSDAPSIWVGSVEGARRLNFGGNLNVERIERNGMYCGQKCHFRLSGGFTYYLVQCDSGETWYLVIDTDGSGVPDPGTLERDFHVLQFALGHQMRMPVIVGLGPERQTIASTVGCDTRPTLEVGSFSPVPIDRNNEEFVDEAWAVRFFECICATWRQRPWMNTGFWVAIDMYLDAMRNHLDSDYGRLQIALESLAYSLLSGPDGERLDVRDKTNWNQWVRENEASIRALAVEGREDALVQKILAAGRLSSGKAVPVAFAEHDLVLTVEMKEELRGRNTVVHQGVMAREDQVARRSFRRVRLVRAMVVALLAKATGYGGAINGWELGRMGYATEPEGWWCVNEADRQLAERTFVAHEQLVAAE